MTYKLLECPKCGWVHFGISQKDVDQWLKDWQDRWPTMTIEDRKAYGLTDGPPTIEQEYMKCFRCGNQKIEEFFESKKDLFGHTIQPVLDKRLS
jgi:predicted nucleic-acid-binding Zn-ribbon protein